MQRPSTALFCSPSPTSFVLRSIVLPYLSSTSTRTTSTSTTTVSVRDSHIHSKRAVPLKAARCASTNRGGIDGTSGSRLKRDTSSKQYGSTRTISSFQQVKGHDPPSAASRSSASNHDAGQNTAQRRTREYLGLVGRDTASRDAYQHTNQRGTIEARYTPVSHHAETSAMALQRILQAYTGRDGAEIDGKSNISGRKGKGKERAKEQVAASTGAEGQNTFRAIESTVPEPDPDVPGLNSEPIRIAPPQEMTTSATSLSSPTPVPHTPPAEYPPMITRLLKARLFRLTVFHMLSTPQYATNEAMLHSIASLLEDKGAGKLARRLRRGWEVHQDSMLRSARGESLNFLDLQREVDNRPGRNAQDGGPGVYADSRGDIDFKSAGNEKLRLWSDPRRLDARERLPVDHWHLPRTPPSHNQSTSDPLNPGERGALERQQSLIAHYNAHLHYLLTRPYLPSSSSIPTSGSIGLSKINDFPPPAPNLQQLRRLLATISNLEKRGFVPDRQTGNIILRCWLRCSAPSPRPLSKSARHEEEDLDELLGMDAQSFRTYKNTVNGTEKIVRKVGSDKGLTPKELRKMFQVLSEIITSSYAFNKTDPSYPNQTSPTKVSEQTPPSPSLLQKNADKAHGSFKLDMVGGDASVERLLDLLEREGKQKQTEFDTVVKPFARMMVRSMHAMGDAKGVSRVIEWLQAQKKLLVSDE